MVSNILKAGWLFWMAFLLIILFILWLFFGGGDYDYIGLSPLKIGVDSTKYIDDYTCSKIERDNYNAEQISNNEDDICISTEKNTYDNLPDERFDQQTKDKALGKFKCYKSKKISKGERICKEVIEDIYEKPFYCVRPNFLKNPETKRNLELDMYNDELKIAVERNGIQHYKWPNYTGMSYEQFINQVRRDKFKIEICDTNGIYLITVPYTVTDNEIKDYIIHHLPENYYNN